MTLLLAFAAGLLSILSPCVLPLVPVVLAAAARQNRFGPLALAGGLVFAFTATGLSFAELGLGTGLGREAVNKTAAAVMALAGVLLLVAGLQRRFVALAEPVFAGLGNFVAKFNARGIGGQAALGALLGVVWSPCAGPTLGAAVGLAMQRGTLLGASSVMLSFAAGAVAPLLFLAYAGGRVIGRRKDFAAAAARFATPALGATLLLVGASIIFGADKAVEAYLTRAMPEWLVDLTTKF